MTYSTAVPTMRRAALGALLGLCLTAGLLPEANAVSISVGFPVTHTADDNLPGSLRSALTLAEASSGSTVVFQIPVSDPGFNSTTNTATITLAQGPVVVSTSGSVSIAGGNSPSGAVVLDGAQQSRVFSVTGGTVTISALTIQNGGAQFSVTDSQGGGGILNTAALTLTNCLVTHNTSSAGGGGGINNSGPGATLVMTGCTVSQNGFQFGAGDGAGIANSGKLTVTGCTLTSNGNSGGSGNAPRGGGLFNTGTATLNTSSLSGNSAGTSGIARGTGGGGAYSSGTLTLNTCLVSGNSTIVSGGGIINSGGSLTLNACTISSNSCGRGFNNGGTGGGLYNTGTASVTNCLLANNFGYSVAGLYNGGSLTLINSTFSGNAANVALSDGTGVTPAGGLSSGPATLLNDIFYGDTLSNFNQAAPSEIVAASGTAGPTATYSDVQGGYVGAGNINADPLFVNVAGGDYQLQLNSPALHTGAAGTANNGVPLTDIVGTPRPTPPARPSMGAYEVPGTSAGFSAQGGFTLTGTQNSATAAQVVAKFLPGAANASGFTATIDFGDGSALTAGTISADPTANGVYQVTGSHTYASYGSFTVTTVITGPGGTPTATVTSTATIQPAQIAADVTSQVSVSGGGFVFNRAIRRYVQTVTIRNNGNAVAGPVSLVLDGLTPGAALFNPSGATQYAPPAGSPYQNAAGTSLGHGDTLTLVLQLTYAGSARLNYSPRVLAGPGAR